jgi:hypothetical protein
LRRRRLWSRWLRLSASACGLVFALGERKLSQKRLGFQRSRVEGLGKAVPGLRPALKGWGGGSGRSDRRRSMRG